MHFPYDTGASLEWTGTVKAVERFGIRSGFSSRCGAIAGRMACMLAALTLICASVAQGQTIEEGFPVKGGGVSGEDFALSCPSRLVVQAGSSIVLSCSAAAVPEEGIRYEWESLSVGGLDFLSAPDELSPLFMAPSSGAGEKYAYRLTATAPGVYKTADVTVSVEGFSGDSAHDRGEGSAGPGDCSSFAFEGYREGCSSKDEGSQPFGGFSGEEGGLGFPFPGSPGAPEEGLPGLLQAGDPAQQTAPYLDCPPAVFLEELEVGSIECHASDAMGEEFLEYMWEPVGSTTRDYMDNPRLTPEDSPYPSVVTPEAPRYETLESFRSGETTFRYRYRLTATSRATGLSSSSEVEVFVSSRRPSVYCPLEVVVEEGSTVALDCEGVDPLSFRMDYDEDGASIEWAWSGLWGTSTIPLAATDLSSPLFTAPAGSAGKEYHYIASMMSSSSGMPRTARRRVTVTVTGGVEGEQAANVFEGVQNTAASSFEMTCRDPSGIMAGDPDFRLDCTSNESDVVWLWDTWIFPHYLHLVSATDIPNPVFAVPNTLPATLSANYYEYRVRARPAASTTWLASKVVRVVVSNNRYQVNVTCNDAEADEGSEDISLDCSVSGGGVYATPTYTYKWTGDATAMGRLSSDFIQTPTFDVPEDVDGDQEYEYAVTVDANHQHSRAGSATVTITVRDRDTDRPTPIVMCSSNLTDQYVNGVLTFHVYERAPDIALECVVTNAVEGAVYTWAWTGRGSTSDTSLLSAADVGDPDFDVPDVSGDQRYDYTVTATSSDDRKGENKVTFHVGEQPDISVTCDDPDDVIEGDPDLAFACSASGGANFPKNWSWSPTTNLTNHNTGTPTFDVPDVLDQDTAYTYTATVTALWSDPGTATVTFTVKDADVPDIVIDCPGDPYSVYEGSADFALDCSASGAPAGSVYGYAWTARGDTPDTDLLIAGTDGPAPTFAVPHEVDETTRYEYLLTVSARNAESGTAQVTVTVLNKGALAVVCTDPPSVYEGSADFALDCSASGAPAGSTYGYAWTARGSTADTDLLIAGTDGPAPTFAVPHEVNETTRYEYLLTVSAENAESGTAQVTVTVLNKGALAVVCTDPPSVYEGSADFALDCSASGAPAGSTYGYAWTARGSTADTDLLIAGTDGPAPTFAVPDEVAGTTRYEYLLTVSAENAESGTAQVTVTVLNKGALAVVCTDPPSVYEGSADFALDCSASGAPAGSTYGYAWTARGSTADTDLLIAGTDGPAPTFAVPHEVNETTRYEYLLTVSARNAESGMAQVTVTVLNKGALAVVCTDPPSVYEGSADFALDCSASGAPAGSAYDYAWTARGDTPDTALLIAGTDGPAPTFAVPHEVNETTRYEYLLTVSARNAESGMAQVTVTVLNKGALAVVCTDPPSVYEGSADFALDCSASGAPAGSAYDYAWTARGSTADTDLLIAGTDGPAPTFEVLDEVDETTTYEYLLTVSAENAESGSAEVTVTVLNRGPLAVVCTDPPSVYEGSEDFALDCLASGAPAGSDYDYAWTARGSTADTDLLIAGTDGPAPTFEVLDEVDETTTYEYLLTVSAENAESGTAEVTVTVLNRGALSVTCEGPDSIYEGSEDITFDCTASGAPAGSTYDYAWTARGSTSDTALLIAGTDGPAPTFAVPDEVAGTTRYEYLLTVSAENAESGTAQVTVTVLNKGALAVVCTDPDSVYEGLEDFALDCSASGAPAGSEYAYAWTARGSTANTALLIAGTDGPTPTFAVPDEVDVTTTYEYLLTVSAENAESGTAEVTVTVLNRGALSVTCEGPDSIYEGSEDITFDCTASGAPAGSTYDYAWTARGDTQDTSLLSAVGIASPVFLVPDEVAATTTYEYLLTVSAANAEDATAEVAVTVLDRVSGPATDPSSPIAESPPKLSGPSPREVSEASSLGVTVSASSLRFGVQSADTEVSLDPMTDQLSTHISGPYHAGRMTLSPGGGEALDENGEMDLSIELASPVMLRRKGGVEDALIVLSPQWSFAESCEQLSSQAIGGLYTEVTLSEADCRLLYFGGELDLTDVPSGRYAGSMDVILRSGEREETHSVEVDVTVIPVQRVITIGPGGVRFSTSRELPAGLTEEQNLSIYPDVAFLTGEKPNGVFELSNPSLVPLEVTVSARFGYTEATSNGREVVVEDPSGSHLGDLSSVVDINPGVLVLMPGEKGLVRYGIEAGALTAMAERGYAAFFDVASEPRQYVRTDQMPEEVAGDRTARVTMRVPGVYVPGEAASQLRATLVSISYVGSLSATFLVETQDHPFVGEVVAYDGEGRELGRRETLVYTRSRVRIPLDRIPEGGAVFLRFAPRGSDRVPLPVSVPWDAPRRDIGGIGDKEKTPISASIAGKP